MSAPRALVVRVDGEPMPEAEARALWERFSAWMEEHKGDLAGFAAKEGFASVHPGVEGGRPVLFASHEEAQRAYAPVQEVRGGGSPTRAGRDRADHRPGGNRRNSRKKPGS